MLCGDGVCDDDVDAFKTNCEGCSTLTTTLCATARSSLLVTACWGTDSEQAVPKGTTHLKVSAWTSLVADTKNGACSKDCFSEGVAPFEVAVGMLQMVCRGEVGCEDVTPSETNWEGSSGFISSASSIQGHSSLLLTGSGGAASFERTAWLSSLLCMDWACEQHPEGGACAIMA